MGAYRRWTAGWMAAILMGLAACGGGGGGGGSGATATPPPDPNSAAATLDAAGGQVAAPSGVSITVPAGALAAGTTIRIAKDSTGAPALPADPGLRAVGDMLALTPHGSTFSSDVTLSVPAPAVSLADNEELRLAKAQPGGQWDLLPTTRDGDKLVATVRSFSFVTPMVVAYRQPLSQAQPLAVQMGTPTCNGVDCSKVTGIGPWHVEVPYSNNGGQLPRGCSSASVSLALFGSVETILGWRQTDASGSNRKLAAFPENQSIAVDIAAPTNLIGGYFWVNCDPNHSVNIQAATNLVIQVPVGSSGTSDNALKIVRWPQSLTAVAGVPTPLTAEFWSYLPSSGFKPTDNAEAVVEWQRSSDGGASWRSDGVTRQADGQSKLYGVTSSDAIAWQFWDASHGITPSLADDGSLWRLKACSVDVSKTTQPLCVTSSSLRLTVQASGTTPAFTQQPRDMMVLRGQTASFTAVATASPDVSGWQWQSRPANSTGAWTDIAGATRSTYTTAPLDLPDNGTQYRVLATNAAGSTPSDTVTAAVSDTAVTPSFSAQPLSLSVITGSEAVFAVAARGTEGLSYQWRKNGAAIAGANASTLKLPATALADAGTYSVVVANAVGSITSQDATLTVSNATPVVVAPSVVTAPASVQVHVGDGASFGVGAGGTGPLTYQWFKDGSAIAGATQAVYTLPAVAQADAGSYTVMVSNSASGVTANAATLSVLAAGGGTVVAPSIDTPPATLTVTPGLPATLAVGASGSGPLSYQWSINGIDIPGATAAALTLPFVTANDAGAYRVQVSNSAGTVLSAAAQIVVVGAPAITVDLADISVVDGGRTTFSVTASGNALHYVWLRNGEPYASSTDSPTLAVPVTLADSGSLWRVLAYNGAGIAFSRTATLTVTPAPPTASCTGPGNTGWCSSPVAASPSYVAFGSPNVGLAVESAFNTQVLRTTDGGVTWTPQAALHTSLNFYAYGLAFADANTAILTGMNAFTGASMILRSTDAGLNWTQVYTAPFGSLSGYLQAPVFINASVGLAPANGQLLRTTDGGATWSVITLPTGQWLNSLAVLPSGVVLGQGGDPTFVVGATTKARLLRSTDGGQTWGVWGPPTSGSPLQYLAGLSFVDNLTGMAVINASGGTAARLARTTDGGQSWAISDIAGTTGLFNAVAMAPNGTGVATNGNVLLRTADAGATWQAVNSGTPQPLGAATSPSPGIFVVVGNQVILRNTQGGVGP